MAAAAKRRAPGPARAELVHPEIVKRYRLILVDETGKVVTRLPEIPAGVVKFVADKIRDILPVLVAAAKYRDVVDNVGRLFQGQG
jgi:hypothetical protein